MKKKYIIIIPILIAVLTFVGVYYYYNREDRETSLNISEKRWIEDNNSTRVNIEIPSDVPIFSLNGSGIIAQFLNDFEESTTLPLNKISYTQSSAPSGTGLRVRILNNETALTNKDLLIYEDNYAMFSKTYSPVSSLEELSAFNNITVGSLEGDVAELTYYLKESGITTIQSYASYSELFTALNDGEIEIAIAPYILSLDQTIGHPDFQIIYNLTEMNKRLVLTLADEDTRVNSIISKYYENWRSKYYVSEYNKTLFKYYTDQNNVNDKTRADLISKNYVYGYVSNAPYEAQMGDMAEGIASEYLNRLARLTGIEFEYKEYKSVDELKNAIANGEVDVYFDYDGSTNDQYTKTISPFNESYVVLGRADKNEPVPTFESLKGVNVNLLNTNVIFQYFKDNSRALLNEGTTLDALKSNDNLIVLDKEVYNYYKNSKFSNYEVFYEGTITNDYYFMVKNDNTVFSELFNYIMTTNSYQNYRNEALTNLNANVLDRSTFEQLYLIILGIVLLPIVILLAIYIYLHKKRQIVKVKREDRRKYTDMMTGLKNRSYLNLNIESWDDSNVYPQGIVIVDLNSVKYVNDNHGHEAGDDLIIKAAGILVNTQLENSEIIRTDGNEFLVYLVGYSESQIATYVKKLNKEMKDLPYGFGASVGYSMIVDDIKTIDDAINEAVLDMRTNKEEGK